MYSNNFRIFVETRNPGITISDAGILAQLLHGHFAGVKPTVAVAELIPTAATTKCVKGFRLFDKVCFEGK